MANKSSSPNNWLSILKLPVGKPWLYLTAGLVWSGVGILLNRYSYYWFKEQNLIDGFVYLMIGILLAIAIYTWGFSKLALKNVNRIQQIDSPKASIFAFQKWSSYPLVAVMIAMGIFLRKYSQLPHSVLLSLYTGIGGGLLLASFLYYQKVWREYMATSS